MAPAMNLGLSSLNQHTILLKKCRKTTDICTCCF